MKKSLFTFLTLGVLTLTSCNGAPKDTIAPEIDGVLFEATCKVGDSYDLLNGITAYDETDGDITDRIEVDVYPSGNVANGIFTPEHMGEYEISYSVSDNAGNKAIEYTGLTVEAGYSDPELYKSIELSKVDMNGWELTTRNGVEVTTGMVDGKYQINTTNSDLSYDSIVLHKTVVYDETCDYELNLVFESDTLGYCTLNGEAIEVKAEQNNITLAIPTEGKVTDGNLSVELYLAGIGSSFELLFSKLDIISSKGVAEDANLLEDFDMSEEGVTYSSFGDGASGSFKEITKDSATLNIATAPNGRGCWNARLFVNTGLKLSEGDYTVSIDVISSKAYSEANGGQFELMLNSGTKEKGFDGQGEFYGYKIPANTKRTISCELNVKSNKDDLIFMFQLGQVDSGESDIDFTVSNVQVICHSGNRIESHDVTNFLPTGFECHNSEDVGAEGEAYVEGNSLVYHVTSFGNVDWNNKLVIKDIELEADKLYIVRINMNASNTIKANIFLNSGEWNPILAVYDQNIGESTGVVEAETTNMLQANGTYELLLQFGHNSTVGETYININSIDIYSYELIK